MNKTEKASSILTRTATQHFFYFLKISDVRDKKKQSTGYFVWKLQKYLVETRNIGKSSLNHFVAMVVPLSEKS